jgi:DNA replication protein DnaC
MTPTSTGTTTGSATGAGMSSAISGKDITGEVTFLARELKAPLIAQTFSALGDQAREQGWSHEEYLAAVLGRQVASRSVNGTRMRISAARLPQIKTLEDFSFTHMPSATRDLIAHLATTTFIARKENVVLLGPPGTGKTHIAIALAIKAAEATYPIAFDSATRWITRLADAHTHGRLALELKRLNRYRALVIDEVGYLPFDAASASLFFQLVASRYETGSILLTSNLAFSRWGETLGDDVVAAATIDRLVHHAHVIALDGDSYRTRAHRPGPPPAATGTKTK